MGINKYGSFNREVKRLQKHHLKTTGEKMKLRDIDKDTMEELEILYLNNKVFKIYLKDFKEYTFKHCPYGVWEYEVQTPKMQFDIRTRNTTGDDLRYGGRDYVRFVRAMEELFDGERLKV